jgi:peptide-methionine (S)-S-oxide reductase
MIHIKPIRKLLFFGTATICLAFAGALVNSQSSADAKTPEANPDKTKLPKTTVQVPEGKEVATLAAGCFWSMEAIFEELKGVEKVEPGYSGGHVANPAYKQVVEGNTGHAEAVSIVFDPKVVSYRDLLKVLLTLRDPTTLNRQGPDVGTNYRSVIFFHNDEQQKAATEAMEEIKAAKVWKAPIVTELTPFANFYQAEDYHRDYYRLNPDLPYNQAVVAPKLADLRAKFASKVKPSQ